MQLSNKLEIIFKSKYKEEIHSTNGPQSNTETDTKHLTLVHSNKIQLLTNEKIRNVTQKIPIQENILYNNNNNNRKQMKNSNIFPLSD